MNGSSAHPRLILEIYEYQILKGTQAQSPVAHGNDLLCAGHCADYVGPTVSVDTATVMTESACSNPFEALFEVGQASHLVFKQE